MGEAILLYYRHLCLSKNDPDVQHISSVDLHAYRDDEVRVFCVIRREQMTHAAA